MTGSDPSREHMPPAEPTFPALPHLPHLRFGKGSAQRAAPLGGPQSKIRTVCPRLSLLLHSIHLSRSSRLFGATERDKRNTTLWSVAFVRCGVRIVPFR